MLTEPIFNKNSSASGTIDNPIIHTNYPGEVATIDAVNLATSGTLPMGYSVAFRIQKDNIKIIGTKVGSQYGFRIVNFLTGIELGQDLSAKNFEVQGVEAIANRAGDNSGFVYLWPGPFDQQDGKAQRTTIVENNRIVGSSGNLLNGAAYGAGVIGLSGSIFKRVNNNIFENWGSGVFQKHANNVHDPEMSSIVENNFIYNCAVGIKWNGNHGRIHNNIIVNSSSIAIELGENGGLGAGNSIGDYNTITNNTFFGSTGRMSLLHRSGETILQGCMFNRIENNLFAAGSEWHLYDQPSPNYDYQNFTNYNLYPNISNAIQYNRTNYSLQGWRNYQLNTHSRVVDANSLTGTPVFVGGATPTTIAGFALAAGSPGKQAGSDGRDMGADVTKVGIQALDSLTITSPNGGESWRRNETRAITWTAAGVTENLTIELMQGPTLLGIIATGVAPTSGSYAWTVGQMADGTYCTGTGLKIRIRTSSGRMLAQAALNQFTAEVKTASSRAYGAGVHSGVN